MKETLLVIFVGALLAPAVAFGYRASIPTIFNQPEWLILVGLACLFILPVEYVRQQLER